MNNETWTIQRMLSWTSNYLEQHGDDKARLSAEWLLCDATGLSRVELYTNFERPLVAQELDRMREGVKKRAQGEPLQYITGEVAFRHIILRCEREVLIPRPETEILVEQVLTYLSGCSTDFPRVLDVCTGTGCIALSVAKERPESVVIATDIAPQAVALASRNTHVLGLDGWVDILEADLTEGVSSEFMGTFDVVVSNPPYIPSKVLSQEVPSEVKDFEPHLALDGGKDGLDIFRCIIQEAPRLLKDGGFFACELFEESLDSAAELLEEQDVWESITITEDLTHRPRIISARKSVGT